MKRYLVTLEVEGRPATFATAHEGPWKEAVRRAVVVSDVESPVDGRFLVRIEFRTAQPKNPNERWDIDNLVKPTLDAMEGIFGARDWRGAPQPQDDRVDHLEAAKRYVRQDEQPGATIEVWLLPENPQGLSLDSREHVVAERAKPVEGPLWKAMNARSRSAAAILTEKAIPAGLGVYAWYRDSTPVYVGKAGSLRSRLWENHLRRGQSMTNSAFRRNVAEELGIATAKSIKDGTYAPSADDVRDVNEWVAGCEVAWIECESHDGAVQLEKDMKREWVPPLTKR
jgi:Holliday junction resolvase RusA-like endonuclease